MKKLVFGVIPLLILGLPLPFRQVLLYIICPPLLPAIIFHLSRLGFSIKALMNVLIYIQRELFYLNALQGGPPFAVVVSVRYCASI